MEGLIEKCNGCNENCKLLKEQEADKKIVYELYEKICIGLNEDEGKENKGKVANDEDETDNAEAIKVFFLNGNYGSGKSYKVNMLNDLTFCNMKENKFLLFDSFQSGFNDNFIYILYLKANESAKIGNKIISKTCSAWENKAMTIMLWVSMIILFATIASALNLGEITDVGLLITILLIIFIVLPISIMFLPNFLTIKKDYSIINRDYFYKLVLRLLPDILVIDDFERLEEEQRKQIFEFIDFCSNENNLPKTKLKRILILGQYNQIVAQEVKNLAQVENTFDKYYNHEIKIPTWFNTIGQTIEMNFQSYPIEKSEKESIESFFTAMNQIVTRRMFNNKFLKTVSDQKLKEQSFLELFIAYYKNNDSILEKVKNKEFTEDEVLYRNELAIINEGYIMRYSKEPLKLLTKIINEELVISKNAVITETKYQEKQLVFETSSSSEEILADITPKVSNIYFMDRLINHVLKSESLFKSYIEYIDFLNRKKIYVDVEDRISKDIILLDCQESSKIDLDVILATLASLGGRIDKEANLLISGYLKQFDPEVEYSNEDFKNSLISLIKENKNLKDDELLSLSRIGVSVTKQSSNTTDDTEEFEVEPNEERIGLIFNYYKYYCYIINNYVDLLIDKYEDKLIPVDYKKVLEIYNTSKLNKFKLNNAINKEMLLDLLLYKDKFEAKYDSIVILAEEQVEIKNETSLNDDDFSEIKNKYNSLKKLLADSSDNSEYLLKELPFKISSNIASTEYLVGKQISNKQLIEQFEKIKNFDEANDVYNMYLEDRINMFNLNELILLVKISLSDTQIYNRKQFKLQMNKINKCIRKFYDDVDEFKINSNYADIVTIVLPSERIDEFKEEFEDIIVYED